MLISNNIVELYQQEQDIYLFWYHGISSNIVEYQTCIFSRKKNILRSPDKSSLREAAKKVGKLKFPRRKFSMEKPCRCYLFRCTVVFLKFYIIARKGSALHGPKTKLFRNLSWRKIQIFLSRNVIFVTNLSYLS